MMTDRVRKIREKYFDTIPQITAERLVLAQQKRTRSLRAMRSRYSVRK